MAIACHGHYVILDFDLKFGRKRVQGRVQGEHEDTKKLQRTSGVRPHRHTARVGCVLTGTQHEWGASSQAHSMSGVRPHRHTARVGCVLTGTQHEWGVSSQAHSTSGGCPRRHTAHREQCVGTSVPRVSITASASGQLCVCVSVVDRRPPASTQACSDNIIDASSTNFLW